MPTMLERARLIEAKLPKKEPKPEPAEVVDVFRAYLNGEITANQAGKVMDVPMKSMQSYAGQFLLRAYKAGRLVWKKA